jgi:hypothetical protein
VLKPGGILRCQINGLPPHARQYDTWSGVRIAAGELRDFTARHELQLLALEGTLTQYMWMTCRKRPTGWAQPLAAAERAVRIRNVSNASTGEAAAPCSGPLAAISLWIERLPAEYGLNEIEVTAAGRTCRAMYIGPPDGEHLFQVNAALPEGTRTGLVPIELRSDGRPFCREAWLRIVPTPAAVPRIDAVTDGINLLSATRIVTRTVKVTMSDVVRSEMFHATINGLEIRDAESFCVDPLLRKYEFNFHLPPAIPAGSHEVRIALGCRAFPPVLIEVA